MMEPCASSTARDTIFSEAMSSISFCWRPSSFSMAFRMSGSLLASPSVKKPAKLPCPAAALLEDIKTHLRLCSSLDPHTASGAATAQAVPGAIRRCKNSKGRDTTSRFAPPIYHNASRFRPEEEPCPGDLPVRKRLVCALIMRIDDTIKLNSEVYLSIQVDGLLI